MDSAMTDGSRTTRPMLLGLGANLGDPVAQLARAVALLRGQAGVDAVSSVWRTQPQGYDGQPDFYNLVVAGAWAGTAEALLEVALGVERALGRVRSFANAPRVIDVDVLALGDRVVRTPALVLPHPRMHARGFVLHPLDEVAPDWRHPILGRTARELLNGPPGAQRVERWGRLDLG
jgi:2-amino-4-hydroxy-6-hydroxymethyldihydropteridine diphosphokinase